MITPFELSLRSGQILGCPFTRRLDLYHASEINAAGKSWVATLTGLSERRSGFFAE